MPDNGNCEFDVEPDCLIFITKTNGDHIEIGPHAGAAVHLGQTAAKNLAYLINGGKTLTIEIKEKVV